jgi:hypothetical protein
VRLVILIFLVLPDLARLDILPATGGFVVLYRFCMTTSEFLPNWASALSLYHSRRDFGQVQMI